MSAYKSLECDIVDKDILLKALSLLGFECLVYDEAKNLTGYQNDVRAEKAEIIIPKEQINSFTGASNDIGFLWNEEKNKYDMIISDYDKKLMMHNRIIQAYVKIALEEALEKNGYKIKVNIDDEELLKKNINEINIVARKII